MNIKASSVLPLETLHQYKIHFAVRNNEKVEPLDIFYTEPQEWRSWNTWRKGCDGQYATSSRDDFSRKFIFSLIRYYHEPDKWLFAGIFEVVGRKPFCRYEIKDVLLYSEFIGRLIIQYPGPGIRGRAFNLENHFPQLEVATILEKPYEGEAFQGHKNVELRFAQLETIISREKQSAEWKAALDLKGVYLIADRSNGKMYIGSASGESGIWSRWTSYHDGTGGNHELKALINLKGTQHARAYFYFSILELLPAEDRDTILKREEFWKRVLQTRDYGYNSN